MGSKEGLLVGDRVGFVVGIAEGSPGVFVGERVGFEVGIADGFVVGIAEGSPGVFVGERDGFEVGIADGDGVIAAPVGFEVGIADGDGVTPAGDNVGANISSIASAVFRQTKSTGTSLLRSIAALLPTQQVSSPVVSKQ